LAKQSPPKQPSGKQSSGKQSRSVKTRIDDRLVLDGLADDLRRARALVMAGQVLVDDAAVSTSGTQVKSTSFVRLRAGANRTWASRGALKLAPAIETFAVPVDGRSCLDIGASTGGFTDVLLKAGAARVFAVDVGYGQLLGRIRNDSRVVTLDRTNARHLTPDRLDHITIDLVVADVSFTSVATMLPSVVPLLSERADLLIMVKPQFEVDNPADAPGGVVSDPSIRAAAVNRVSLAARELGLVELGRLDNAVHGPSGNVETFLHLGHSRV
jgi:23S rRNA (cytidine1920-2'-O)/16S rRNA (cytidine1409-2'-O)-methyltransferase